MLAQVDDAQLPNQADNQHNSEQEILPFPVEQSDTSDYIQGIIDPFGEVIPGNTADSSYITLKKPTKKQALDAPVRYLARDSMAYYIKNQMLYLYGDAQIFYTDIELKAAMIAIDIEKKTIYAAYLLDSIGEKIGRPVFKQGEDVFEADSINYNFETKKGYIKQLRTEQQGGYLHSETTKRLPNEHICLQDGKFTTCNADEPHFYISLKKAILIPNEKIVSGPINLVIADIPTPAWLPFGFFPTQKKFSSGVIIPEYGEERNRGFFLKNGGYYLALSDYYDLALRGDIYSRGTWGLSANSNYNIRYRFSGNVNIRFYDNRLGEEGFIGLDGLPKYSKSEDFSVRWTHRQDPKANPGQNFSANVDFSTSGFDRNHTYSADNRLQNTKNSSISYSKSWGGQVNFSTDLRHSQNSQTEKVNLTFPSATLNVNRQYPFRRKTSSSNFAWYENIQIEYKAKLQSTLQVNEDNFFSSTILDSLRSGFQHDIPLSANFKFWNHFNFNPSLGYIGKLYTEYNVQEWDPQFQINDTTFGKIVTRQVKDYTYAQSFSPVASLAYSPTIYGMFSFSRGPVLALRHVMTPSISFNIKPGLGEDNSFVFRPRVLGPDSISETQTYSIYDGSLFGSPIRNARSGSINFNLGNNIELKTKTKSDTATTDRKVKIIEQLNFRTRYDIYKEERNLDPVTVAGSTTLFKDVKINFGATLNPYLLKDSGEETADFSVANGGPLFRLTTANYAVSYSIRGKQKKKSTETDTNVIPDDPENLLEIDEEEETQGMFNPDDGIIGDPTEHYVNFNLPWSLRVDYNWHYSKPLQVSAVTSNLRIGGELNLTEKWKISINSGYDFNRNEFTYTTIDIYRDMHCWEARFSWVPFGTYMSYQFQLNVKPGILQDLKYNRRRSWFDNF